VATLTDEQAKLFEGKPFASVATTNADGSPQLSYAWVEWDGENVVLNTTAARVKGRNLRRDPRVVVMVVDPENPYRWLSVKGHAEVTEEGAVEHIDELSRRYWGRDYDLKPGMTRLIVRIRPERVNTYGFES
jgi:PPOX class probable F420-dependent enzyme